QVLSRENIENVIRFGKYEERDNLFLCSMVIYLI
ncbi:unnamed protein product, partial [Rotaria magnacalcarata]